MEYVDWLKKVEESADALIENGPKETRAKRSKAIKAIVSKVKMRSVFYVTYMKDLSSFADEAIFKLAQKGLMKEHNEFQESLQAYNLLNAYLSKDMSIAVLNELKGHWLKDRVIKRQILTIEKNMRKLYKGVRAVKVKVPRRRKDLFLDSLLIQCDLAFDKTVPRGRNGKIAYFVNAVYGKEIYPNKTGAERVRKKIDYILKTAKGATLDKQYSSLIRQWEIFTNLKRLKEGRIMALEALSGKNLH